MKSVGPEVREILESIDVKDTRGRAGKLRLESHRLCRELLLTASVFSIGPTLKNY